MAAAPPNNSSAAAASVAASTTSTVASNDREPVSSKSGGSILQELCSRQPKSYMSSNSNNPPTTTTTASSAMVLHETGLDAASGEMVPMAPASPSFKMKIKRSNSTSSRGHDDETKPPSSASSSSSTSSEAVKKSKKRKEPVTGPNSSSSTSSSRSSSPRSSASPISHLPPFLLAAMTGGMNNGPRLDALLRQVAQGGPPLKKAKLNGDLSNGSVESDASSPTSVASPLQGNTSGGHPEASTMTEPDTLGPCEPGTAVKLSGIVWQETDKGGLLMLNVTWKGKTYIGTLLDCHIPLEEHKWGPPGDVLAEKARGKRGRNTRSRTPPVRMPANRKGQKAVNNKNNARAKLFSMPVSPLAKENGNKKAVINSGSNSKSFDDDADAESDITKDEDSDENNPGEPEALSPTSSLIECPKPNCAKKFRDLNALKYHLSYAHNDLKKAAAIAAEKRKKILNSKANKTVTTTSSAASSGKNSTSCSPIKKEMVIKSEMTGGADDKQPPPPQLQQPQTNGSTQQQVKTEGIQKPTSEVMGASLHHGGKSNFNNEVIKPNNNIEHGPLDLHKRPVSPAYSDISDEEPAIVATKPIQSTQPLPASVQHLSSLNNLSHRPQNLSTKPTTHHQPSLQPPPAHGASVKKPSLSLEETLKRPPQFGPPPNLGLPGFPPGLPGLLGGAGLPAHLAAAVASGRYPPGFMPVTPGFMHGGHGPPSSSTSALSRPPYMPPTSAASAAINSASAKLQELQDRVMASSTSNRSLHLGLPPTSSAAAAASLLSSAVSNPSAAAAITSYSNLARDLLPPAHFSSLSRMASMNPGLSLPGASNRHLPTYPPK